MSESLMRGRVAEREKRSDTISLRNDRQLRRLLRTQLLGPGLAALPSLLVNRLRRVRLLARSNVHDALGELAHVAGTAGCFRILSHG